MCILWVYDIYIIHNFPSSTVSVLLQRDFLQVCPFFALISIKIYFKVTAIVQHSTGSRAQQHQQLITDNSKANITMAIKATWNKKHWKSVRKDWEQMVLRKIGKLGDNHFRYLPFSQANYR